MTEPSFWMRRCLDLARLGAGTAAPNPMVGAVLVQGEQVLAEGWHQAPGGPHAEVACLAAFGDGAIPGDAVLYVNLEPCSHHGRTPPCTDVILARGVKRVVVAHVDPFPEVSGSGIERLRSAGVEVSVGVAEAEARWTNRRFLTSIQRGRPYVILKWAQSSDGFLDRHPRTERGVQRISSPETDVLVHRWRSEEQAIVVGSRTVINDDPQLDVRHVEGRSPMRVVLDREGATPLEAKVHDGSRPTLVFTCVERKELRSEQIVMDRSEDPLIRMMAELHERQVRSVMVEGGAELLGHFIQQGLWDEARVITGDQRFENGTSAPSIPVRILRTIEQGTDRIDLAVNDASGHFPAPDPAWPW